MSAVWRYWIPALSECLFKNGDKVTYHTPGDDGILRNGTPLLIVDGDHKCIDGTWQMWCIGKKDTLFCIPDTYLRKIK